MPTHYLVVNEFYDYEKTWTKDNLKRKKVTMAIVEGRNIPKSIH
jgi:hypothetical protein